MRSHARWNSALIVGALALGLVTFVGAGITTSAEQNRRWWWDNLAGPDSSNFVDSIRSRRPTSTSSTWPGPIPTPHPASIPSSSTT